MSSRFTNVAPTASEGGPAPEGAAPPPSLAGSALGLLAYRSIILLVHGAGAGYLQALPVPVPFAISIQSFVCRRDIDPVLAYIDLLLSQPCLFYAEFPCYHMQCDVMHIHHCLDRCRR